MRVLAVVVSVTVLAVSGFFSSECLAAPNTSRFLNKTAAPAGKMNVWVAKRHSNDGNYAGDIAVAFQIVDDNLRVGNELEGVAYVYDKIVGGKYVLRKTFIVKGSPQGGHGGSVGENSRRRETCTFTDSTTDPRIRLRASLSKGKDHGNVAHRRVVLRYKEFAAAAPVPAGANGCDQVAPGAAPLVGAGDCCDEEPNEDVLEEDTVDFDPLTGAPILPP